MKAIVILPFFWSLYLIIYRRGIVDAFLYSYLPCLILISPAYSLVIQGLPDLTFSNMAFLPVFVGALLLYGHRYRPIILDFFVLAFFGWEIIAENHVAGYWSALSVAIGALREFLGPYFVARLLIGTKQLSVERFIKVFVFLGFLNILTELHSVIFGFSLQDRLFRHIFVGTHHGLWFMHRFGLPRLQASFNHSITAGLFFAIIYRLHRWLQWNGMWEPRFRSQWMRWAPKAPLISVCLLFMLVMSISRGPWLAALVGAFIAGTSLKIRPRVHLLVRCIALGIALYVGYGLLEWYVMEYRGGGMQGSARYRWDLYQRVQEHIDEKPIYGWGVREWPIDKGTAQSSIDNAYLFYALKRGYVGLGLFLLILGWQTLTSFVRVCSQKHPKNGKKKSPSLEITLFSVHVTLIVALGTVWIDQHLLQIYIVLSAMSGNVFSSRRPFAIQVPKWRARKKYRLAAAV
jgi:hypothetical protein